MLNANPGSLESLFESLEKALYKLKVIDSTYLNDRPTLRQSQLATRNLFGDRGGALGCYVDYE